MEPDEIKKLPYAEWLEETLQNVIKFNPSRIALVAINDEGKALTAYHKCGWTDLFTASGTLYSDGIWLQIEDNVSMLKRMIESAGDEDD